MRPMKILMLVSSMHAGGAERVAATLVNAWAERGDEVTLTPTYSSKGSCFYPLSDKVRLAWLADLAGTRASGAVAAFKRLLTLRRHVRDTRPDVVVSFLTNVNVAAILATRGLRAPLIVCERTNPTVDTTTGQVWRRLRRLLYPRADMVTVQAEATAGPFARQVPGIKRLAVIPNPLPAPLLDAPLVAQRRRSARAAGDGAAGAGQAVRSVDRRLCRTGAALSRLEPAHLGRRAATRRAGKPGRAPGAARADQPAGTHGDALGGPGAGAGLRAQLGGGGISERAARSDGAGPAQRGVRLPQRSARNDA